MDKWILPLLLIAAVLAGCEPATQDYQPKAADPAYVHRAMKRVTDVIVHDIFSPPVASRIYAYTSIAAYEAGRPHQPQYPTLAGQLRDLAPLPQPDTAQVYCFPLASVHALLTVGKALTFSADSIAVFEQAIYAEFEALRIPDDVYERSMAYGQAVSAHVLAWAGSDNYKETRTAPKYTISKDPSKWRPTPPAYMPGIEPHWNKIRPFVLDSAQQFVPPPPTPFSTDTSSAFYREAMEVYHVASGDGMEEKKAIASFWDCNPYVMHQTGHVMFATKKITPGGHWVNIVAVAARKAGADLGKVLASYALTSVALADGFISCWDEKYRSNLVRPETVIQDYIDEDWMPMLQTPPFPEHTSGHSVISTAAAVVLTHIYGDNFSFEDDTELEFGLPARTFPSFLAASEEAAMSRMYGGIHYRPAIEYGVEQGQKVGALVLERVKITQ